MSIMSALSSDNNTKSRGSHLFSELIIAIQESQITQKAFKNRRAMKKV